MNIKTFQLKLPVLITASLALLAMLFLMMASFPSVSAQQIAYTDTGTGSSGSTSESKQEPKQDVASTAACSIKVNRDKCIQAIEDCMKGTPGGDRISTNCTDKANGYADVIDLCKKKVRPQACHESVKARCSGKKGSDREKCEKGRADDFKTAASGSGTNSFFDPQVEGTTGDRCGNEQSGSSVETKFDFGCLGNAGPNKMGAIEDVVYSLVRFLTAGIGIVIVIAIIVSGIQYSASQGSPEATAAARNRIQNVLVGLAIYLFAFAIIQFLVPGGLFE